MPSEDRKEFHIEKGKQATVDSFFDELEKICGVDLSAKIFLREKIAGVGLDIHGYRKDPFNPPKKLVDVYEGDTSSARIDWQDNNRQKTKFDNESGRGYKLHLDNLLGVRWDKRDFSRFSQPSKFLDKATDEAYTDTPVSRNLSRNEVRDLIQDYSNRSGNHPYEKAFVNKAKELLKNRGVKFIRLEYE